MSPSTSVAVTVVTAVVFSGTFRDTVLPPPSETITGGLFTTGLSDTATAAHSPVTPPMVVQLMVTDAAPASLLLAPVASAGSLPFHCTHNGV